MNNEYITLLKWQHSADYILTLVYVVALWYAVFVLFTLKVDIRLWKRWVQNIFYFLTGSISTWLYLKL